MFADESETLDRFILLRRPQSPGWRRPHSRPPGALPGCAPPGAAPAADDGGVSDIFIGDPRRADPPERRMIGLDHHLARPDLGIREHLVVSVDWSARQAVALEEIEPVTARGCCAEFGLDEGRSAARFVTRMVSFAIVRMRRPFRVAEQLAEPPEQPVVGGAERDVPVARSGSPDTARSCDARTQSAGQLPVAKYSVASHTDSATPASTSDVSMNWPRPVRVR